jgi:hypothetical protein
MFSQGVSAETRTSACGSSPRPFRPPIDRGHGPGILAFEGGRQLRGQVVRRTSIPAMAWCSSKLVSGSSGGPASDPRHVDDRALAGAPVCCGSVRYGSTRGLAVPTDLPLTTKLVVMLASIVAALILLFVVSALVRFASSRAHSWTTFRHPEGNKRRRR